MRNDAFAWVIGYFVAFAPLFYVISNWDMIGALIHSIIGVAGAIFLLRWRS